MKFIITEEQDLRLHTLRRIDANWDWISEIVEEGLELFNPCDSEKEDYLEMVSKTSAETYLLSTMDYKEPSFNSLRKFIQKLIVERLSDDINGWYDDLTEEC